VRRDEREIRDHIAKRKEVQVSGEKETELLRLQRMRFMKESRRETPRFLNLFMSRADIFRKDGGFYRQPFFWGFGGFLYVQRAVRM